MSNCEALGPISQYEASPLFKGWLDSFSARNKEICEAYGTLELFFEIDRASGEWLDLIGIIVGQDRVVIDGNIINFLAFENTDPKTSGFGVGKFWDGKPLVPGNVLVDDITYRLLIKGRAFKNASSTAIPDILTAIELLLGRKDAYLIDGGLGDTGLVTPGVMEYAIQFDTPLDDDERAILLTLDLLPRPAGVELATVIP